MSNIRFLSPKLVRRELNKREQNWLRRSVRRLDLLTSQINSIHEAGNRAEDPEIIEKLAVSEEKSESLVLDIVNYVNAQLGLKIKTGESWVSVRRKIVTTYPDLLSKK